MDFEHDSQRATYERVSAYMTQLFGEQAGRHPDQPTFFVSQGSAQTMINVVARGDHSVVSVFAWVVTEVEPSFELFDFLLKANHDMVYGAFAVDSENDISFSVNLYGDTLDKEELDWTVRAVVITADEFDDKITQRFGGLSARDRAQAS